MSRQSNSFSIFNSVKGVVASLLGGAATCIAVGFAAGRYYEEIKAEARIREIENKKSLEIIECREKYINLQETYQNQILEITDCKLQLRGQKEK